MQPVEIKTPDDLKNIYGKDGALMVDLITKGVADYNQKTLALTNNWHSAFEDPSRCVQAVSLAMIGALHSQIKALEDIYAESKSPNVRSQLFTIKHSLISLAKEIKI